MRGEGGGEVCVRGEGGGEGSMKRRGRGVCEGGEGRTRDGRG